MVSVGLGEQGPQAVGAVSDFLSLLSAQGIWLALCAVTLAHL